MSAPCGLIWPAHVAVALLAAVSAPPAHATVCAPPGIVVFPSAPAVLPSNGVLIVEGSDWAVEPIGTPVWRPVLIGARTPLPLGTVAIVSPFPTSIRLLLRPPRAPTPAVTVRLETGVGPSIATIERITGEPAPGWSFSAKPDHKPPRWGRPPTLVEVRRTCGLLVRWFGFVIRTPVSDDSGVTIAAEIRGSCGGALIHAAIDESGSVFVGNVTCNPRLVLEPGAAYTIALSAIDYAGHVTRAPGEPLHVVVPKTATCDDGPL